MISTKLTPEVVESALRAAAEVWDNIDRGPTGDYLSERQQEALALTLGVHQADTEGILDALPERCRIVPVEDGSR